MSPLPVGWALNFPIAELRLMQYHIVGTNLYYGDKLLGPASTTYVDSRQYQPKLIAGETGLVRKLAVGDYVLVGPTGLVIGVEEKRLPDLVSSWWTHRLHRQLRQLLGAVDVAVLAIRAPFGTMQELVQTEAMDWSALLKWQMLGGYLGFLPYPPMAVLPALMEMAAVLRPGSRSTVSILKATDVHRKVLPDLTPTAQALGRLVPGVGLVMGARLASAFHQDLREALAASDEEWAAAGANKSVLRELRRVIPWPHAASRTVGTLAALLTYDHIRDAARRLNDAVPSASGRSA